MTTDKTFAEHCYGIFEAATEAYHIADDIDAPCANPYTPGTIEHTLFAKNHIDAAQWHMEDIIRDPDIDPVEALVLKRRIDKSNQDRTDMVEELDTYSAKILGSGASTRCYHQHREPRVGA